MLDQAEASKNPRVWEVVGRTCLLVPPAEPELRRAIALIDRAMSTQHDRHGLFPFFRAAKGFAECRADHPEAAIAIMDGDVAGVLGPAPQLIVAISLSRLGRPVEARRALARAVVNYDWSPGGADTADEWMCHVLRREAQAILPDLSAFLDGRYQPRDSDERLAMTAECQFRELTVAHAHLWAESFAADPSMEMHRGRERAVPAAAMAGCDIGKDAAMLTAAERARWRRLACEWCRAELATAMSDATNEAGAAGQQRAAATIRTWSTSPDLAGVRDPAALARLPPAEQMEWTDFWQRTAPIIKSARPKN
jgi:serine/threonine-protein kinase